MCVETILSLKINLEKSELIPIEEDVDSGDLERVSSYRAGSLQTTYLGLPLGAPFKSL